jgi:hypothetical protein
MFNINVFQPEFLGILNFNDNIWVVWFYYVVVCVFYYLKYSQYVTIIIMYRLL